MLARIVAFASTRFFVQIQTSKCGLSPSAPTVSPYPPEASVSVARQLRQSLMESPEVVAMRVQSRSVGFGGFWHQGIRELPSGEWQPLLTYSIVIRLEAKFFQNVN